MKKILYILLSILGAVSATSCINDAMSTSAADQPVFSTDTLRMGTLFTSNPSPTFRFLVYNRHSKGMNISRIAFADDPSQVFRINVDGMSGREFQNVEIRPNDSIFVFVEATLPPNNSMEAVDVLAHIEFNVNGVTSRIPVTASGRDVHYYKGNIRFFEDTTLPADRPLLVMDSLVVEPDVRLTVPPGAELYFHDNARVVVYGSLSVEGTADAPVEMRGDRFGNVAADIPYEIMSGQWFGIDFMPGSTANSIAYASIRNTVGGIYLDHVEGTDEAPGLLLLNSQVRNTQSYVLAGVHSHVEVLGCELTDASQGIVALIGGRFRFNHCTIANYYLFTAPGGAAVQMWHLNDETLDEAEPDMPRLSGAFENCIIHGLGYDLNIGDLTDTQVMVRNTLFKSEGTDDDQFINCIWATDPLYYTDRENYIFDYRLQPESPARGAADPALTDPRLLTDRYGTPRPATPSLGAYE